jgi:predicted DNA-binding mobile mystery protein A
MQINKIARRQLDKRFAQIGPRSLFARPPSGWLRAVRVSLGMTASQLGARLRVSKQAVLSIEDSETRGAITLNTLQRMANALDCTLYYAIVPNKSLEQMVQTRAHEVAAEQVSRADQTMRLENQSLPADDRQAQIDDLADELVQRDLRSLWRRTA